METPRNYDFYGFQIIYLEDKNISDPKTVFKDHDVISSIFTCEEQIWIVIYGLNWMKSKDAGMMSQHNLIWWVMEKVSYIQAFFEGFFFVLKNWHERDRPK